MGNIEYHRMGTPNSRAPVKLSFTDGQLKKARHVFDGMAKIHGLIDSSPLSDELLVGFMFSYAVDKMLSENKNTTKYQYEVRCPTCADKTWSFDTNPLEENNDFVCDPCGTTITPSAVIVLITKEVI